MELRSVPENIAMAFNPLQPVKINSVTGAPMHSSRATHYSSHSTASRLKAWLRMNKAKNHLDPRKKSATFFDYQGVLRYVDTWQAAERDSEAARAAEDPTSKYNTGCIQFPLDYLTNDSHTVGLENTDGTTTENCVRFIADWQILWNYLQNDKIDELATYSSLFRIYVEFIFHKFTAKTVLVLVIYNIGALIVVNEFYSVESFGTVTIQGFISALEAVIYLALRILFKGSILGDDRTVEDEDEDVMKEKEKLLEAQKSAFEKKKDMIYLRTHPSLIYTFKKVIRNSFGELRQYLQFGKQPAPSTRKTLSYYNLLNISLKFLTRHNAMEIKETNFNRLSYRVCLLFILFGLPVYTFYIMIVTPYLAIENADSEQDKIFARNYFYATFFGVTGYLLHYLFAAAVLVSLVGLAYGAEIAYRMTDSWIQRFNGLRRVPMPAPEEDRHGHGHGHGKSARNRSSNKLTQLSSSAVNGETSDVQQPQQQQQQQHQQAGQQRQQQESDDDEDDDDEEVYADNSDFNSASKELMEIVPLLSRDACEHYLFIREYMNQAGKLWSVALVGVFVIFIFIVTAYLYAVFILKQYTTQLLTGRVVIYIAIRFVVLVIYPVISLSHANSFVYILTDSFEVASPKDFEILGGRDMWVSFLNSAPAVWTVFGLWVTWDKLVGFLWMIFSTGAAIILTMLSSSG